MSKPALRDEAIQAFLIGAGGLIYVFSFAGLIATGHAIGFVSGLVSVGLIVAFLVITRESKVASIKWLLVLLLLLGMAFGIHAKEDTFVVVMQILMLVIYALPIRSKPAAESVESLSLDVDLEHSDSTNKYRVALRDGEELPVANEDEAAAVQSALREHWTKEQSDLEVAEEALKQYRKSQQ